MALPEYSTYIMDCLDVICYISDPKTYDLLYLNKKTCEYLNISQDDYRSMKCYEALQDKTEPCEFCTNHLLHENEKYRWTFYNRKVNRLFSLLDTLIDIDGKLARLEFGFDMTEQITEKNAEIETLKGQLTIEETLVSCIRTLSSENNIDEAIWRLLKNIGEFYDAERAYIFEFDFDRSVMVNTYEWCRPGVTSEIGNLQAIPLEAAEDWIRKFEENGEFMISSLADDLDPQNEDYKILDAQGIRSLMAAPLVSNDRIVGMVGVDDPAMNTDDLKLLTSIPFFILDDLEKRRMIGQLEYMSYTDALTGAGNRNRYIDKLKELENNRPDTLGVVYLDINGLKAANDTHGHQFGDNLIKNAASMMRECFSDIYRVGGDEFISICPNIGEEAFQEKVSALKDGAIRNPGCNVSIGSSWKSGEVNVLEQTIRADEMMYGEKQSYYKSNMSGKLSYRREKERRLLSDIRAGKFTILLQPKIDLKDGRIAGAEALVRMRAKDGSLTPAADFLPLYEEEGIIKHIDLFVLDRVCKTLQGWSGWEMPLGISINFSWLTFLEKNIVEQIGVICKKHNTDPESIELETTERFNKIRFETLRKLFDELREKGFSITLDNFGTHDSNLETLSDFDFSTVKFDQRLMQKLVNNEKAQYVFSHTVKMLNTLPGTKTLAEGVESEDQYRIVKELGYGYAQGYYFSEPVTPERFGEMYMESNKLFPADARAGSGKNEESMRNYKKEGNRTINECD